MPLDLRREGADLFHAPHYVLPPLTPCQSVVTIHDCIHLRFPQYLPNRLGYAYARSVAVGGDAPAGRVLTVSEASKRDILRYFGVRRSRRSTSSTTRSTSGSARRRRDEDVRRVRERYQLNDPFVLYAGNIKPHKNLERLIEAFHMLRRDGARPRQAAHHRRRDLEVRRRCGGPCTATSCTSTSGSSASFPIKTLAVLYRLAARVRVSVALRRLRPAAARSDGQRHTGHHVERVVAAGGRRRRGAADRSLRPVGNCRQAMRRVLTDRRCARNCARAASRGSRSSRGSGRSAASGRSTTRCSRREGRARPRLADRHAWGRKGSRRDLRAVSRRHAVHTSSTSRVRCRHASKRAASPGPSSSGLPGAPRLYRHFLPLYPWLVEGFDLDGFDLVISSSHCAVKSVIAPRALHVCYCHSPMRYAWDQFPDVLRSQQVGAAASRLLRPVMAGLARWDAATATRPDRFLANSQYVAGRIGRYYNRRSAVVYPPVDTDYYRPTGDVPAPSRS